MLTFGPNELIIDNFAGGGGASTGIAQALGRDPDIAINHDPEALAMHAANHPNTLHLCEDVWNVDIAKVVAGRPVGLAWFSPDCKHFSVAKGGKPVEKKIRGLAWVALRWAGIARPRVIMLENVREFKTWGPVLANGQPDKTRAGMTFKRWCTQLRNLGYKVEMREIRACDFGAPTIRKRLFIIARRDGQPIVWPEPTHGPGLKPYRTAADCIDWSIPCPSIFLTKEEGRKIGVNRPLADKTMARIAKGVKRYVIDAKQPFIVNLTHAGGDRLESVAEPWRTVTGAKRGEKALVVAQVTRFNQNGTGQDLREPLDTVMAGAPRFGLTAATMVQTGYGERAGQSPRALDIEKPLGTAVSTGKHALVQAFLAGVGGRAGQSNPRPMDEPTGTTTAKADIALVTPFLAKHYGGHETPGSACDKPVDTITTQDHNALVAASLVKLRGTCKDGQPMGEPMATVSAGGTHIAEVRAFLVKYYGAGGGQSPADPLHTVTSKDRLGLVMVEGTEYQIVDIGMRMLTPRELFRAQGFPESYVIDHGVSIDERGQTMSLFSRDVELSKTAQVRMCGNSVSPHPAAALVRAQFTARRGEAVA